MQAAADTPAVAEFVGLEVSPLSGRGVLADLVAASPRAASVADALATTTPLGHRAVELAGRMSCADPVGGGL